MTPERVSPSYWRDEAASLEYDIQHGNPVEVILVEHVKLCEAHADALEEVERLKAERDTHVSVTERLKVALRIRGTGSYVEWAEYCRNAVERAERAESALAASERKCERLKFHAEAMAGVIEEYWNGSENEHAMADALCEFSMRIAAYRAEFKE